MTKIKITMLPGKYLSKKLTADIDWPYGSFPRTGDWVGGNFMLSLLCGGIPRDKVMDACTANVRKRITRPFVGDKLDSSAKNVWRWVFGERRVVEQVDWTGDDNGTQIHLTLAEQGFILTESGLRTLMAGSMKYNADKVEDKMEQLKFLMNQRLSDMGEDFKELRTGVEDDMKKTCVLFSGLMLLLTLIYLIFF